jgi:hypothetical protein
MRSTARRQQRDRREQRLRTRRVSAASSTAGHRAVAIQNCTATTGRIGGGLKARGLSPPRSTLSSRRDFSPTNGGRNAASEADAHQREVEAAQRSHPQRLCGRQSGSESAKPAVRGSVLHPQLGAPGQPMDTRQANHKDFPVLGRKNEGEAPGWETESSGAAEEQQTDAQTTLYAWPLPSRGEVSGLGGVVSTRPAGYPTRGVPPPAAVRQIH